MSSWWSFFSVCVAAGMLACCCCGFYVNGCVLDLVCTVSLEFFESSCGCFSGLGWSEGF